MARPRNLQFPCPQNFTALSTAVSQQRTAYDPTWVRDMVTRSRRIRNATSLIRSIAAALYCTHTSKSVSNKTTLGTRQRGVPPFLDHPPLSEKWISSKKWIFMFS